MSLRADGPAALEWVASYLDRLRELPVLAQVAPGEIRAALPDSPPERGEDFSHVLRDLDEVLLPGLTHWQSSRFFAYLSTTGSDPAILADLLAAGLNQVGILWRASPALQELEEVTLAWLAEQAHSSVERACRLLGMELRKVRVDADFRLRPDALELDGASAVVGTVGTTSTTSVDPIRAIVGAAASQGAWVHVDAAYAGLAAACPELHWAFDGIEGVDSLVVNPHKWLTTQGCSAFWTRRPEDLRAAFSLVPEYLRTPDEVDSFSEYTVELGRSFRALKLWAALRCYGREGVRETIRRSVGLAELFEGWVREAPGWELCAPRPFSVVCFRREGSDEENEALLERVNASGEVFLSGTRLNGRFVLRLACGNARQTEDDVRVAWEVLCRSAR